MTVSFPKQAAFAAALSFLAPAAAFAAGGNAPACPSNALGLSGAMTCSCAANSPVSSIWGTTTYTADSDICTAAMHSGAINAAGGTIQVVMAPGQNSYPPSTQNGVSSGTWSSYDSSFSVLPVSGPVANALPVCGTMPSGATTHSCSCGDTPGTGSVWGSNPYTSDSDICTAALHAGAIGSRGGPVNVIGIQGLNRYSATTSFGVTTSSYGSYTSSITFDWN